MNTNEKKTAADNVNFVLTLFPEATAEQHAAFAELVNYINVKAYGCLRAVAIDFYKSEEDRNKMRNRIANKRAARKKETGKTDGSMLFDKATSTVIIRVPVNRHRSPLKGKGLKPE